MVRRSRQTPGHVPGNAGLSIPYSGAVCPDQFHGYGGRSLHLLQDVPRSVLRCVIHDDQDGREQVLGKDGLTLPAQKRPTVVCDHDRCRVGGDSSRVHLSARRGRGSLAAQERAGRTRDDVAQLDWDLIELLSSRNVQSSVSRTQIARRAEGAKRRPGRSRPAELGRPGMAPLDQDFAQLRLENETPQAIHDRVGVEWVDQQGGVAGDLSERRYFRGENRSAGRHCLQRGDTETLG